MRATVTTYIYIYLYSTVFNNRRCLIVAPDDRVFFVYYVQSKTNFSQGMEFFVVALKSLIEDGREGAFQLKFYNKLNNIFSYTFMHLN